MPLRTTAIGAFPKPTWLGRPDWFSTPSFKGSAATIATSDLLTTEADEAAADRAVREVVRLQVDAGVDVPTDGEIRRENYIHYHCRHLDGIDFGVLSPKTVRAGTWEAELPTVVGPIERRESFLDADYAAAQSATGQPVKITLPGPLTIMDSTANTYYESETAWGEALANALNGEVLALATAGCTQIQIDEPVLARHPEAAEFTFGLLDLVLDGVPDGVTTTLHICCGYPDRVDNPSYPKADASAYLQLAEVVDASPFDAVSLEDAHRHNPALLFERLESTTVVLGAVEIANSRVETVEEVVERAAQVAALLPSGRLMLAPDCGLGLLGTELALAKLRTLRGAADALR